MTTLGLSPGREPLHSLPPGFGITFMNLDPAGRAAILGLIAAYETGLR